MRVLVIEKRWVEVKKTARERIAKCERERLCVACLEPLGDEEPMRGCHCRCYHATYRAIKSGKFTDSQRVQDGKLLEPQPAGRKPSNPVSREAS